MEGVLHDLRNPLQGITMAARTIADSPDESDTVAHLAPVLVKASDKLVRMLDHLAISRTRADDRQAEPTALQAATTSVVSVYRGLPMRRGPSITDEVPTDLPAVFAVEPHLRHVMLNLVLNASEALGTRRDGAIWIKAALAGDRIVISVEDNGPGLAPGLQESVFEPFFTTKAESGHLGLGLSVGTHLVNQWGGSLSLEHRQPEGGMRAKMALRAVLSGARVED